MPVPIQNIKLEDQDNTSVQGFESINNNVIIVDPGDCPHCLKSFSGRGAEGTIINVFTAHDKSQWCAACVRKGIEEGICIQESKLTKEEKKLWEKKFKKESKINY